VKTSFLQFLNAWNWLDWILVIIVALSILVAVRKGFIRELISLAAVIVGLIVAGAEYARAGHWFEHFTKSRHLASAAGFLAVFVFVMLIGAAISLAARLLVQKTGVNWADRLLGGVFGLVRGIVIDSIVLMVLMAFAIQTQAVRHSELAPYVSTGARAMASLVPENLRNSFEGEFRIFRRAVVDPAKDAYKGRGPC
jgi:membrane protein required for colicin V production